VTQRRQRSIHARFSAKPPPKRCQVKSTALGGPVPPKNFIRALLGMRDRDAWRFCTMIKQYSIDFKLRSAEILRNREACADVIRIPQRIRNSWTKLSRPAIAMMESTDSRYRNHFALLRRLDFARCRRVSIERKMSSVFMIISKIRT